MRSTGRTGERAGLLVLLATVASIAPPAWGTVLHVDDDAEPGGDGTSWASAFRFLQDALDEAQPVLPGGKPDVSAIHVAEGLYLPDRNEANPDGTGDREATFSLVSFVDLVGGFAGLGGANPDERDLVEYEAILSGDLVGDDGAGFASRADNSYHVVSALDMLGSELDLFTLDGFTVRGGNADGADDLGFGGGFYSDHHTSPLLANCTIKDNEALNGGGIGVGLLQGLFMVAVRVRSTSIVENRAKQSEAFYSGHGGGIRLGHECDAFLLDCDVSRNVAARDGGGINASFECLTALVHCTLAHNEAGGAGGAVYEYGGWPRAMNTLVAGNTAQAGGGLWFRDSDPYADLGSIRNTIIHGNTAETGGGVFLLAACEFAGFGSGPADPFRFDNCIIWGNEAPAGAQITVDVTSPSDCGYASIDFSDVEGNLEAVHVEGGPNPKAPFDFELLWGDHTIDADPRFVDPTLPDDTPGLAGVGTPGELASGFALRCGSPCIDAGDSTTVPADFFDVDGDGDTAERVPTDFAGLPRFADDPLAVDTGLADPPSYLAVVDIGAIEHQPRSCPADLDSSGSIGFGDLVAALLKWGPCDGCAEDVNCSGDVGLIDVVMVLMGWGSCPE